ncbi:hypothetical protein C8Q74DRAFT_383428 [Fomes fomentarius]|nr:hypothetical protein C8Q74DRAFT_383428 [Fomes fomentarius]
MSARAPFVPRAPSRVDSNSDKAPGSPASPYEAFRPNSLLVPETHTSAGEKCSDVPNASDDSGAHSAAAAFKPLNLSGLSKARNASQGHLGLRSSSKPRPPVDSAVRAPKPFASAQHNHLADPRPSSPFFPNNGMVSMSAFRAPPPPPQSHPLPTGADDLSANKAHIPSSFGDPGLGDRNSVAPGHRSRTASHPSLASIYEVDEEDEHGSPRKMGPPINNPQGSFSGDYQDDFSGAEHTTDNYVQGLRRAKRAERTVEDEDEYEYGTAAKRYKMTAHQDEYAMPFASRAATPARYLAPAGREFERTVTPAQSLPIVAQDNRKTKGDMDSKQALYTLLGQDLDICVEAHADSYEQARKKWSECSQEEWTRGADELAERFGKLLDFVKEHMTTKLSLYASLQNRISEHRSVLSEREKALNEARESLVREGGAVVGGAPKLGGELKDS